MQKNATVADLYERYYQFEPNPMAWLEKSHELVGTYVLAKSVLTAINEAFDKLVKDLRWEFDAKYALERASKYPLMRLLELDEKNRLREQQAAEADTARQLKLKQKQEKDEQNAEKARIKLQAEKERMSKENASNETANVKSAAKKDRSAPPASPERFNYSSSTSSISSNNHESINAAALAGIELKLATLMKAQAALELENQQLRSDRATAISANKKLVSTLGALRIQKQSFDAAEEEDDDEVPVAISTTTSGGKPAVTKRRRSHHRANASLARDVDAEAFDEEDTDGDAPLRKQDRLHDARNLIAEVKRRSSDRAFEQLKRDNIELHMMYDFMELSTKKR
jgi:hypothetical protein